MSRAVSNRDIFNKGDYGEKTGSVHYFLRRVAQFAPSTPI